ncbi:phosphatase PAP2 family protein [Euzebya sp.]|uniref:phosphatase PAP2 family protein n=1 Tax=Euzebya sp. TaxID=1971409 RepID=UPI0035162DE7
MAPAHRADARLGDVVRATTGRVGSSDDIARLTTDLGSMFMVVFAAATLSRLGHHRRAIEVLAAGTLGWSVAQQAKEIVDRPRPYEAEGTRRLIPEPVGSSMPSGHSAVVFAVAAVLADRSRPGRRWPWPIMALWVPMTRVHLGVHYPADTLVGATLGLGLGRAVLWAADRLWDAAPAWAVARRLVRGRR